VKKAPIATRPAKRRTIGLASVALPRSSRGVRKKGVPSDLSIYQRIAAAIFEQRLPPGTKLTEDTLGGIFGVSRTIIRNALLRLAHERIVEIRPNRSAVVARPSREEAQHVFEARRVVEAATVASACVRAGRAEIMSLRELAADEIAARGRGDRRAWVRLSGMFHLALAEAAGNAVLGDFLKDLVARTSLIVAINEAPGKSACALDEHRDILDAVAKGDVPRAVALMTRHLESCEDRLNLSDDRSAVDLHAVFGDAAASEPGRGRLRARSEPAVPFGRQNVRSAERKKRARRAG
jgi:DNA-binding GntR family transcriptional regulator